ncbi:MAG TPA: type II toxin-antitoxin system antitoxin SocA domain-containing protein [Pyrinomonadaceae bacterium]|nr:type II toxin-antitoxin system antitoxin SocA domain-containing protein [Pyrinomonadaceae bacterium]
MAYDARSVANGLLKIAQDAGRTLTNMQLQKLVYIAHGYALAILHKPLIKQSVEAWRYGPVVADLYHALRAYGAGKVTASINILPEEKLSETHLALLAEVVSAYGGFSGPQLSTMTHRQGTPWKEIYDPAGWGNSIIPDPLIEQHYINLLNERAGIIPG